GNSKSSSAPRLQLAAACRFDVRDTCASGWKTGWSDLTLHRTKESESLMACTEEGKQRCCANAQRPCLMSIASATVSQTHNFQGRIASGVKPERCLEPFALENTSDTPCRGPSTRTSHTIKRRVFFFPPPVRAFNFNSSLVLRKQDARPRSQETHSRQGRQQYTQQGKTGTQSPRVGESSNISSAVTMATNLTPQKERQNLRQHDSKNAQPRKTPERAYRMARTLSGVVDGTSLRTKTHPQPALLQHYPLVGKVPTPSHSTLSQ
ncbi:unnamed protein product, partial [Ectocarpus sp. 12 AP-2014]